MNWTPALLSLLLVSTTGFLQAQNPQTGSNDRSKLAALFASAADNGGNVTIPPGDYDLDGSEPIPLCSQMTVTAY